MVAGGAPQPSIADTLSTRGIATGAAAPVLTVRGLTKRFGEMTVVDDVAFDIIRGSITGLIGPNGAGKTTLFNTLCGTIPADHGEVTLDGVRLDRLPPHRILGAGLARTFQIPRPFPEMTVLENVMIAPLGQPGERFWNAWFRPGRVRGAERAIRERAMEVLEFTTLSRLAGQPARMLSGGQKKLLELARVLMADPKMILLDEPAAGVNPALMDVLLEKITTLNEQGITFLLIEHNMDLVMSVCHPVMVMAQGAMLCIGDADTVRNDPRVLSVYLGEAP
ncbi:MAG: ABC transporter ATP-binding protein [Phycisphaerales bacterium]